jgi:hypothetical protein
MTSQNPIMVLTSTVLKKNPIVLTNFTYRTMENLFVMTLWHFINKPSDYLGLHSGFKFVHYYFIITVLMKIQTYCMNESKNLTLIQFFQTIFFRISSCSFEDRSDTRGSWQESSSWKLISSWNANNTWSRILSQFENKLVPSWERSIWEKDWELVSNWERARS